MKTKPIRDLLAAAPEYDPAIGLTADQVGLALNELRSRLVMELEIIENPEIDQEVAPSANSPLVKDVARFMAFANWRGRLDGVADGEDKEAIIKKAGLRDAPHWETAAKALLSSSGHFVTVVGDLPSVTAQLREVWIALSDVWLSTPKWRLIKRARAEARLEQAYRDYQLAVKALWIAISDNDDTDAQA